MVVLDTGLASSGTMVPLSNSAEIMFIVVTIANKTNTNPLSPALELITKSGFSSTGGPPRAYAM